MKPISTLQLVSFCVAWLLAFTASAQILISDGNVEACSGVLYDTSGQGGAGYGPAEDFTLVLCSDDGSSVFLEWFNFDLDPASFMTIYDGQNIFAPVLAYSGVGSFATNHHRFSGQSFWLSDHPFRFECEPRFRGDFWRHHRMWFSMQCPHPGGESKQPEPVVRLPGRAGVFQRLGIHGSGRHHRNIHVGLQCGRHD